MATVDERIRFRAPIERVFEAISDHEGMAAWPGVSKCTLIREGRPRNGLGAVRRIRAGGFTLEEKVVHFESPRRIDYTITRGLPIDHLGSVTLEEHNGMVHLRWHVEMTSKVPLLAPAVAWRLRGGLRKVLRHLQRSIESASGGF